MSAQFKQMILQQVGKKTLITESSSKKSWYNCQKHKMFSNIDKNSLTHIPQHVEPIVVEDDAGKMLFN